MDFPRSIYAIQHNVTKRMYVGSSKDVRKRYIAHMGNLRNGKHPVEDMQEDFDLYGEDFSLYVLEEITSYDDRLKEYEWMRKYDTMQRGIGYNYKDHVNGSVSRLEVPLKDGMPEMSSLANEKETLKEKYITDIKNELEECELSLLDLVLKIIQKRKKARL